MADVRMPLKCASITRAFLRSCNLPLVMKSAMPERSLLLATSFLISGRGLLAVSTSIIHLAATWDVWVAFIWIFLARTYLCTLNSLAAKPGTWARSRSQIRCNVCRSFHGSDKSSFSIVSINGIADAIFGRARCGVFRFGGALLFNAARTVRRWTLNFRATPLMVPTPCSYSRRNRLKRSILGVRFRP
jgi:hypothetical protein